MFSEEIQKHCYNHCITKVCINFIVRAGTSTLEGEIATLVAFKLFESLLLF